ncbi:MAG TPA: M48 family metallopeptidase [Bacteroidota bacterium]|nr:M48 family metallopeptidase [Bacteroidota bacterium]
MNLYAVIIAAALAAEYLLHLAVDLLNLKALGTGVPAEFAGVYDPATYRRSQEYTRTRTLFGIVVSTAMLALTFGFWFAGGFNVVDVAVRGWGLPAIPTGLAFIGILALLKTLISLPFSAWSTFVIEARIGFNRTTPKTFIADLLKGMLLSVTIGGLLVAGILFLFEWAGPGAWAWCWGFGTVVALVLQFIAPVWLMPLFNKFTPLPDGPLKERILKYASEIGFPLQGIYMVNGSKRSSKSNAYFTGFGKFKRIALFDTLIARHTAPELVAVLAHEIGHYRKKHIRTGMIVSVLRMGAMLWILSMFVSHRPLFDAFFMENVSVHAGLIIFGLLFTPIEFFLSLAMHALSRKHEFEADRFAAETLGGREDLVSALKKLSADNLSNLTPHPAYVFLHYSHPPVLERIRRLSSA